MDYSNKENLKQIKSIKSRNKKVKKRASIIAFRIIVVITLISMFAIGGAVIGAVLGIIENAPDLSAITIQPNIYTSIIYEEKTGNEVARLDGAENREYANLETIPLHLRNAFISIEDERFYTHNGIDIRGIFRAIYSILSGGRIEGASTLTQQLIKNNVTGLTRNTLQTKIQEQYLAIEYEKILTNTYGSKQAAKDHILELYLNSIALGHGLNGVRTAASYYFNKNVSDLSLAESAVIASITQNPTKFSPKNNPDQNAIRKEAVLSSMLRNGYITESEMIDAQNDDVYSRISEVVKVYDESSNIHSYFIDELIKQVSKDLQEKFNIGPAEATNWIYNGGLKMYITQDLEMQSIMDAAFLNDSLFPSNNFEIDVIYYLSVKNTISNEENHYERRLTVKNDNEIDAKIENIKNELIKSNEVVSAENIIKTPQPQAAMVIIDYTSGQVKAISGGRGQKIGNRVFNRATDAERQPGSVFKVLASYAPAIDLNLITPGTILVDEPYTIPEYNNYTPRNWYSGYRGKQTVRKAIADSMNILAVRNLMNTGIEPSFQYLQNFGFTTLVDADKVPALALGGLTRGVTQLEVTTAFGTIANDGEYNKPIFYTKVLNHSGEVILENVPQPNRVLRREAALLLTDMMKDVITNGTGGRARFRNISMPIAGKTGTTTDIKDLTFVGYTPYYVAGIWLGFDSSKPMRDNNNHLDIWRIIMEQIHAPLQTKNFTKPTNVSEVTICKDSGLLAIPGVCEHAHEGDRTTTEIFTNGNIPTEYCNIHTLITIDKDTGMIASEFCPPDSIMEIVATIIPSDQEPASIYEFTRESLNEVCTLHGGSPILNNEDDEHTVNSDTGIINPILPLPTIVPLEIVPTPTPTENNNTNIQPTPTPIPTPSPTPEPIYIPEYNETTEIAPENTEQSVDILPDNLPIID